MGFQCYTGEEHVGVGTRSTAHCGTITDKTICDPDTEQVIPEATTSLVDWVKATVRFVYPEERGCLPPSKKCQMVHP